MKKEEQLRQAREMPYFRHLGIEIVEIKEGFAKLRLEFEEYLTHPFGSLHGGAIASMADSAGVNAVMTVLDEGQKALTLEMKINYLSSTRGQAIYGEGRVIHKSQRFAVSDVEIRDADGQFIAKAIVTCVIQ